MLALSLLTDEHPLLSFSGVSKQECLFLKGNSGQNFFSKNYTLVIVVVVDPTYTGFFIDKISLKKSMKITSKKVKIHHKNNDKLIAKKIMKIR